MTFGDVLGLCLGANLTGSGHLADRFLTLYISSPKWQVEHFRSKQIV